MSSYSEERDKLVSLLREKTITLHQFKVQLAELKKKYPIEETTPKCNKCGSFRLFSISGHCVDSFNAKYTNTEFKTVKYDGYVPGGIGIGGGDDIEMDICMACGRIQDEFPISDDKVMEKLTNGQD